MEIISADHSLRVYERGAGKLKLVVAEHAQRRGWDYSRGYWRKRVKVDLPGGSLDISWEGPGSPLLYDRSCNACL